MIKEILSIVGFVALLVVPFIFGIVQALLTIYNESPDLYEELKKRRSERKGKQ